MTLSTHFAMRSLFGPSLLVVLSATAIHAQAARRGVDPTTGVLIVAHGASPAWNAGVDSLAAAVKRGGVVAGPVAVSFLMGQAAASHRFQDAVADLKRRGAHRIVVVPLLVSSFSGHYEQIRYLAGHVDTLGKTMMHHLHMAGIERVTTTPIVVTPALDDAVEMARVLGDRAKTLAPSPSGRALFLFGHGPNSAEDYAAWMTRLRVVADSVKTATGFASVAVELVRDDAPAPVRAEAVKRAREIIGLQRAATGQDVIVVPILVSSGSVANQKLPADLAGLPIIYAGTPLLPHAQMAAWVERRVLEAVVTP
jgi:sirohydrochlorin cobaltochelatase